MAVLGEGRMVRHFAVEAQPAEPAVAMLKWFGHYYSNTEADQKDPVLLVRSKAGIFPLAAHCTHYHGPLADGVVVDGTIRCPWHHARFDLRSGEALRAPAFEPLTCRKVEQLRRRALQQRPRPAISLNMINPETGNRIKMVTTDPDTGPVERSSLVKGYVIEKNNYVLFTNEEIKAVQTRNDQNA